MYVLDRETTVPAPRDEVFPFFEDPRNLAELTPKEMGFRVRKTDDLPIKRGFRIEYTIKIFGLPVRWTSVIEEYDPPNGFTDVQAKGPYQSWRHTHTFEDAGEETRMRDRVQYELPFGILGSIVHRLFVSQQLKHIFDYRERRIRRFFKQRAVSA